MKLAIFTNILNPYRTVFFDNLFKAVSESGDTLIVYSMVKNKSDRPWNYSDFKRTYTRLLPGITFRFKFGGYIHFNTTVRQELKDYHPDVVVMAGSYVQPTNIKILRLARKFGYKTVFWSESHFDEERNYGKVKLYFREWFRRRVLHRFDAFWFPGKKAEEFIDTYRQSGAKKIIVPNTVDNNLFRRSQLSNNEKNKTLKNLFTPARLVEEKGLINFLSVLQKIPKDRYCWRIAGDGPLEMEIIRMSALLDCNVVLLGPQKPERIKQLYHETDIFVLPSVSDPNPLSCVEALWMGLPLFVSEHVGNYPEVIDEGVNGYIFSYSDIEEAIYKLERIINADDDWYNSASECSFKKAQEHFDIEEIAHRVIEETKKL